MDRKSIIIFVLKYGDKAHYTTDEVTLQRLMVDAIRFIDVGEGFKVRKIIDDPDAYELE